MLNRIFLCLFILLLGVANTIQAEEPASTPLAAKRTVRISFLPPPLDGTISLGIYDPKGKLVRVLYREADVNEFNIGADALTTTWDGKDDAGADLPPGKYGAHGVIVGDLSSKSIGFYFNDFVASSASPRIRHLRGVRFRENELYLDADLVRGEQATLALDPKQGVIVRTLPLESVTHCDEKPSFPNLVQVIDCDSGPNNTVWVIDSLASENRSEVKQLSNTGELLRRIVIAEGEPMPRAIAASPTEDKLFLVEESPNSTINRLRAVSLPGGKTDFTNGDLKTDFEKKIVEHQAFAFENGKPVLGNPKNKASVEKITVKLQPNPLLADARVPLDLGAGFDQDGSFLKTSDGLPLFTISENSDLIAVSRVAHGSNALDVFQDDGAVLEQVRLGAIDQMMTFDCGVFELK